MPDSAPQEEAAFREDGVGQQEPTTSPSFEDVQAQRLLDVDTIAELRRQMTDQASTFQKLWEEAQTGQSQLLAEAHGGKGTVPTAHANALVHEREAALAEQAQAELTRKDVELQRQAQVSQSESVTDWLQWRGRSKL